jgi:DNA-binding CsgD family transcriptional regulator
MNKPLSRWRSIALLAVVIMGFPFYVLFNYFYFYGKVDTPSFIDTTVLFIALFLLTCVLLGNNRLRALISASFIFSIINLAQFPVVFFTAIAIHPVTDLTQYIEDGLKYPQLYYGGIFFINIIITICCLLASRWLRNTKLKPPLNLYVPFNLLFIFFTLIVLFWWEDFSTVMAISFLSSFFMGTLLIGILVFLFYLYTRLTTENLSAGKKETENLMSLTSSKDTGYALFVHCLSKRELEVVEAVLAGNVSYKQLSSSLNISVNTVKTHLKHIYQTTGVSNITALSILFRGYNSNHP